MIAPSLRNQPTQAVLTQLAAKGYPVVEIQESEKSVGVIVSGADKKPIRAYAHNLFTALHEALKEAEQ